MIEGQLYSQSVIDDESISDLKKSERLMLFVNIRTKDVQYLPKDVQYLHSVAEIL